MFEGSLASGLAGGLGELGNDPAIRFLGEPAGNGILQFPLFLDARAGIGVCDTRVSNGGVLLLPQKPFGTGGGQVL